MPITKRERQLVPFRLIWTPCCNTLLCWVNPRLPNYCSECGEPIYRKLKFGGILAEAEEAWLETRIKIPKQEIPSDGTADSKAD